MVSAKKPNKSKKKKLAIEFGKFHEYAQTGDEVEIAHELAEEEKRLLMEDFIRINKIEKEEEAELKAIKHFEKKLQDLIENVVYVEGYIEEIKEGHSMLKVNPSVKELGHKLAENIEEVEKLSKSMLNEEKKIFGLAKHVKQVLSKAKHYQSIIFG